jgi:hypothetical protein
MRGFLFILQLFVAEALMKAQTLKKADKIPAMNS